MGRWEGRITTRGNADKPIQAILSSDPKGFIGLVTIGNTVPIAFSGNVTLDPGSITQIIGNLTLSDPKAYIGVVTLGGGTAWVDPKTYIGLATVNNATAWPDPKTFIGLATIVGNTAQIFNIGGSNVGLNTYSLHSTTNGTVTPAAATAYISSIAISAEVAGTTSTLTIQDKSGTPLKLVNGFSTTVLTTTPTVVNFQSPIQMISGIDIITGGAVAATIDVWLNYYQ